MKLILFLLTVFYLVSCADSTQKKTISSKSELNPKVKPLKKYLTYAEILELVKNTKPLKLNAEFPSPFDTLQFNKVIAYDFDGKAEGPEKSIVDITTNKYASVVLRQKELNNDEVEFLIDFLSDKKSYGDVTRACFEPHLGIVFYQGNQAKYVIDICLDCNYLKSTTEIPASVYHKTKMEGIEYALNGFSQDGRNKIIELSKKLKLDYGKIKPQQ